jgi:hypothetical protein
MNVERDLECHSCKLTCVCFRIEDPIANICYFLAFLPVTRKVCNIGLEPFLGKSQMTNG